MITNAEHLLLQGDGSSCSIKAEKERLKNAKKNIRT